MGLQDDVIWDVGANNGDDTAYYLHRGFRVLAIEADPSMISLNEQRFATEIAQGRLTLLNIAVAAERTVAPFWICEGRPLWNSFDRAVATRDGRVARAIELEFWPLRDVIAKHGVPHYLKLSLHGDEHICLADLTPETAPKYLSLELPRDVQLAEQIVERLVGIGYSGFKVIDQTNQKIAAAPLRGLSLGARLRRAAVRHPRLYRACKPVWDSLQGGPAAEAADGRGAAGPGGWTFPAGSSGPFGEDTDGVWQPSGEALVNWKAAVFGNGNGRDPNLSLWHDLHAARR